MKRRPIITLILLILSAGGTLIPPSFDSSLFGIKGAPLSAVGYSPIHPLRLFGGTILLSPFLHMNLEHFFMNALAFIPISLMIERKTSLREYAGAFCLIHLLTMILLTLLSLLGVGEKAIFMGLSHVVVGLFSYLSCKESKKSLLIFPALVIVAGWCVGQSKLTLFSHVFGILSGILLGSFRRLELKKRS
jgi:membrane associated rhomboid family serine protease